MSRERLEEEVIDELRRSQSATQAFDQAVADYLGVNGTDFRCLDIIQRRGNTTPGEIARESGLTSGAVTAVIDRLARAGYAERLADPKDRRRVLVRITPEFEGRAIELYKPLMELTQKLFATLSEDELRRLRDFSRAGREINEQLTADMRARMAGEDAKAT